MFSKGTSKFRSVRSSLLPKYINIAWGTPMVPLVGNIFTVCTNLITNGIIGKEIGANGKMVITLVPIVQMLPAKWYHWENP